MKRMLKSKKGDLMSQPFIWIFMIIVIGLIVVFGGKALLDVMDFGCSVESTKLVKDFKDNVDQMYSFSSGSKDIYTMLVPSGMTGVCFVDASTGLDLSDIPDDDLREIIEIKLSAGDLDENMFFIGEDKECLIDSAIVKKLKTPTGVTCFNLARGSFKFVLENAGDNVLISKP
jgi:hypothetical protein